MSLRSFSKQLGEQLGRFRREARITQKEAGGAVGKSASTIRRWEGGDGSPTVGELYTLARLFKRPLLELAFAGGEGDYLDVSDLPPKFRDVLKEHVRLLVRAMATI